MARCLSLRSFSAQEEMFLSGENGYKTICFKAKSRQRLDAKAQTLLHLFTLFLEWYLVSHWFELSCVRLCFWKLRVQKNKDTG